MKLKPIKKASFAPLAVSLFKAAIGTISDGLVQDNNVMSKMRGNPKSRVLLITPPCSVAEYEQGVPFCGEPARLFHVLLHEHGFDTQKQFLVTTCCAYGDKPSKHSTEVVKNFILKAAELRVFDYYVCVGDTPFKYIFGQGKKPASGSLYGSTVFVPETGYKPLFTFPDPACLMMPEGLEDWQMRKFNNIIAAHETKFHKHCRAFAASLKQNQVKL